MSEETLTIEALKESNDILQEEVTRLKYSNRTLRTAVHALRTTCDSLRRQTEQAAYNDEMFKALCNAYVPREISDRVVLNAEGGLPDATGTVEPLSAEGGEAS